MRKEIRYLVCFVLLLCTMISVRGQIKDANPVQIDLNNRRIKGAPFDVRFDIEALATEFEEIKFSYEIEDRLKNKSQYYFVGDKFSLDIDLLQKKAFFPKKIGPFHPEVFYNVKLEGKRRIKLTPVELTAFKSAAFDLIEKYFFDIKNVGPSETKMFKKELLELMKATSKTTKIYDENENEINFDAPLFNEDIYKKTIADFINYSGALSTNKQNIENKIKIIKDSLQKASDIFTQLNKISRKTLKPSKEFKKKLDRPLNSALSINSKITLLEIIDFLRDNFKRKIENVIEGKGKIIGNIMLTSDAFDMESFLLILSMIEKLKTEPNTLSNRRELFDETQLDRLNRLHELIYELIEEINVKLKNTSQMQQLKNIVPNLLNDKFIQEKIRFKNEIELDVFAEKSPYIGLDLGILYAFDVDGIFSFQGTNFYLKPINREAPFKNFEENNWDRYFFKRFSIYLGIAQILTDKEDNFDDLFASTNLVAGFGYRLSRTLRLSIGGLMYNEKNPSPLIDSKKIRIAPTLSMSIDIDLTKAIGAVGTALNF